MNRVVLLLFTLVVACAAMVDAQVSGFDELAAQGMYLEQFRGKPHEEVISKVWLEVCRLNRGQYLDSNLVRPGDVIALPFGKSYIAQTGGKDHMWQASKYFVDVVVTPYLVGSKKYDVVVQKDSGRNAPRKTDQSTFRLLCVFLLLSLGALAWMLLNRAAGKNRRPFATSIPSFEGASDAQVRSTAQSALESAFGRGFEIVGPIERGVVNGTQRVFFAGGQHKTQKFENEPGYRARLRFRDGREALVVSLWECFNPVWSATEARFRGTFTPQNGRPEEIEEISESQASHLSSIIQQAARRAEPIVSPSLVVPGAAVPSPASETSQPATPHFSEPPASTPKDDGKLRLTKVQFSVEKGLNLEGELPMSIEDLKGLITQVQTKGGDAPKKDS